MLHGFHHPKFSDIDLIVYGKKENAQMRKTLQALYADNQSGFHNEFESDQAMAGKDWRFKNFTVEDFVWHQRRKQIYGLYDDKANGRTIKAEFEPVKAWSEIKSEYDPQTRIRRKVGLNSKPASQRMTKRLYPVNLRHRAFGNLRRRKRSLGG